MPCVSLKTFYLLSAVFITGNCQPPIVTSPKYLCLGDLVQLTCSAQGSARWRSDDILGPDQIIIFDSIDSINTSVTVGNGTAVLLETDPHIVTSLSFNLTTDRVETKCTDSQLMTTTNISSVQPSPNGDYPMMVSGGSIMWGPPSNIDDLLLQYYQLIIECNGTVVDGVNTNELRYFYNSERLIPGLCNATIKVINSCGDTASSSIIFPVISVEGKDTIIIRNNTIKEDKDEGITASSIGFGIGGLISVLVAIVVIVIAVLLYKKKKKKEKLTQDNIKERKTAQGKKNCSKLTQTLSYLGSGEDVGLLTEEEVEEP